MRDADPALIALIVGAGATMFVAICALFVWYAVALSQLFPRLGGEGWKGWVPVLNEAEILSRGGVHGWSVVFFFIPLVQFYGLYLKVVAVHRLNVRFRYGAGLTTLGILLPPLWATLLARADDPMPDASEKPRVDAVRALPDPRRSTKVRDASGYAIPIPAPLESALIDEVPVDRAAPPVASESAPDPHSVPPVPPVSAPPVAPVSAPPAPAAPVSASLRWQIVLGDGTRLALNAPQIVLGRNPAGDGPGDQLLAVPDETRTLSKTHARLDFDGTAWHLTDLNSTNGTRVATDRGWSGLTPGSRVPLRGPFQLGDVGIKIESVG